MKVVLIMLIGFIFVGCASEIKNRTVHQLLSPDKLNMQIHVNPDIRNDNRDDTEIQQVRLGLDWNL